MAYKTIDPELKLQVVKDHWSTGNVSKTADKYGVSRNVVYNWTELAQQAIREIFQKTTPGRRTVSLEEENRHLKSQLQEVLNTYYKISQEEPSKPVIEPMVVECPDCHSDEICKNGKVYTKTHGLRQRFLCRSCSFLYLACIVHNLITLFRYYLLSDTGLANLGLMELIEKLMDIPAKIQFDENRIQLSFPSGHQYSQAFFAFHNPEC